MKRDTETIESIERRRFFELTGKYGFTAAVVAGAAGSLLISEEDRVAFAWAFGEGSTQIPPGKPCAGTTLGLDATVKRALVERADASGTVSVLSRVSPRFCGRVYLQALDLASCSTTNVVLIE